MYPLYRTTGKEGIFIDEYSFNTGKVLGKIHALSREYPPQTKQFAFFNKYNEAYPERLIPDDFICMKTVTGRQVRD